MTIVALVAWLGLSVLLVIAAGRVLFQRARPCYRCGAVARTEYMGLRYCHMCRAVIMQILPAVRHDPPYGFPGSPGYLAFPEKKLALEKKEEETHG